MSHKYLNQQLSFFLPDFIEIQRKSFRDFLEKGIIEEVLKINPLKNKNLQMTLFFFPEYYKFMKPEMTIKEAITQGKTYGAKLYLPAKLLLNNQEILNDDLQNQVKFQSINLKNSNFEYTNFSNNKILDIPEWVLIANMPLMTKRGHFIINGSPRVLVNQMVRSPGVYFHERLRGFGANKKRTFYIDFISRRGAWLRLQTDKRRKVWARLKKNPKISIELFIEAFQSAELHPLERTERDNLVLSELYQQINPTKTKREISPEGGADFIIQKFKNPRTYDLGLLGRQRINSKLKISIESFQLTSHEIQSAYDLLKNLEKDKLIVDDIDNLKNRRVRASGELLQIQFEIGLYRLEKVIGAKLKKLNSKTLFHKLKNPSEMVLSKEFQNKIISNSRFLYEKTNRNKSFKTSLLLKSLITTKPVNGALREFFGSSPLSQYMDQTNPLAEVTHKRRLSSLGPGGISRDTAGMAVRGIHPTHYGRICPIETPEGKNAGLVNSLTLFGKMNENGFLQTPYFKVFKGQVQRNSQFIFFSAEKEQKESIQIAPGDLKISDSNFLPSLPIPIRVAENFQEDFKKVNRSEIDYMALSSIQMISIATSLIPFLEHDDANRALMGSNMQRQAVPLIKPERPIVGTGLEALLVGESGHILETKTSGIVSYVSGNKIIVNKPIQVLNSLQLPNAKRIFSTFLKNHKIHKTKLKIEKQQALDLSRTEIENQQHVLFNTISNEFLTSGSNAFVFQTKDSIGDGNAFGGTTKDSIGNGTPFGKESIEDCKENRMTYWFDLMPIKYKKYITSHLDKINYEGLIQSIKTVKTSFPFLINESYILDKFQRSNQETCLTQKPIVHSGDWLQKGDILADCSASCFGELALGQNILVAYLPWEGYNFEDAVVINERLVSEDLYTSIHIEKYEIEIRETAYGFEEISKQIPHLQKRQEKILDENGIIQIGSWVEPGDILVGKTTPLKPQPLSPHERLAYDLARIEIPTTRDTSLRVPKGVHGRVINIQILETIVSQNEESIRDQIASQFIESPENLTTPSLLPYDKFFLNLQNVQTIQPNLITPQKTNYVIKFIAAQSEEFIDKNSKLFKIKTKTRNDFYFNKEARKEKRKPSQNFDENLTFLNDISYYQYYQKSLKCQIKFIQKLTYAYFNFKTTLFSFENETRLTNLTEIRPSIQNTNLKTKPSRVRIYIAEKRKIQVGDKVAGRHGNKGIVSSILPRQDMPYLPDGSIVDMILNPLGVPSRMNVGQVFECLLGLAGSYLNENFKMTPFDEIYGAEASRSLVYLKLYQARLKTGQHWLFHPEFPGKTHLFDGRTGDCFDQLVTVGKGYIIKLVHLVDEKIHARSTGPYSLVTKQPLGGRSKHGGQRLGEMEVWALEGFGAAYTLQEMLTRKSDDVLGRQQVLQAILNKKRISLGNPEAFKVLIRELQSLCLDVGVYTISKDPLRRKKVDIGEIP